MKNKAFTLAEILIVLMIMGVLSVIMMQMFKSDSLTEKGNIAKAYKAINIFDEAAANIRDVDSTNCPMGSFIYKTGNKTSGYTYEIGLNLPETDKEEAVLDMFGEFIKFEKTGLNFCDYSKYCEQENEGIEEEENKITSIPAVKFSKDMYAGLTLLDPISNCPSFNLPETEGQLTPGAKLSGETPKCWAKLYIDVNGEKGPNESGKDIFIFGLDEYGVYH